MIPRRLLTDNQKTSAWIRLRDSSQPLWRPISSRHLSNILGVSLQSLANWRVRGTGPNPEPYIKGGGNRVYYRPDEVLSWLSDRSREPWEFSRDWLAARGVQVEPSSQASTEWLILTTDDLL